MIKISFFTVTFVIAGTTVFAGCDNYEDGSLDVPAPKYRICFDDVCDETALSYECANIYGAQRGFANGWVFDYTSPESGNERTVITWRGRIIDEKKHSRWTVEVIGQSDNPAYDP